MDSTIPNNPLEKPDFKSYKYNTFTRCVFAQKYLSKLLIVFFVNNFRRTIPQNSRINPNNKTVQTSAHLAWSRYQASPKSALLLIIA